MATSSYFPPLIMWRQWVILFPRKSHWTGCKSLVIVACIYCYQSFFCHTRLVLELGTLLKPFWTPVWSWYWVQDWFLAGMRQVHNTWYWYYKSGTKLVLPHIATRLMLVEDWHCLGSYETSGTKLVLPHIATRLMLVEGW